MRKYCEMCGNLMTTKDGRRKYCDSCRKVRKGFQDAYAAKEYRLRAKEKRKEAAARLRQLENENQRLRDEIIRLRTLARTAM